MATNTTESLASPPTFPLRRWRLANGIERFFCALSDQFQGTGRVVFLSRFSGPVDEPAIGRALMAVSAACPRARIVIQRLPSGHYEFNQPEIDPPVSIVFQPVIDATEGALVAAKLGQEQFPAGTEPVLRWIVLPSESDDTFQIVGLGHHGLFDAASMAILIQRFLEVLGQTQIPQWNWPEATIPQARWSTFRPHWSGLLRHIKENRKSMIAAPGLPNDGDATGTCVIKRWNAHETDSLVQACRAADTTVTALIGVTGMFALRAHYGEALPHVKLTIPVNVRRYFPSEIADQALGVLIVARNFAIDFRQPVSLLAQTQRVTRCLQWFLKHEGPLRLYRIANAFAPRRMNLKMVKPSCVSANSLGRLDSAPSPSGVRWLECGWFANGAQHLFAFSQSAATLNDCLTVTSYSSWIAGERVRELAEDVDLRLRRFAGLTTESVSDAAVETKSRVTAESLVP